MSDSIKAVLMNGAVWSAVILLANTLLFLAVPDFPPAVWAAINGVIVALLAVLGVKGVTGVPAQTRANRAAREAKLK